MPTEPASLSGRRRQAAANDLRIVEAARTVFLRDPTAPVSAVAEAAGVGMSALYRRYPSKEHLLQHICTEGLARYTAELETALADDSEPWAVFAGFMRRAVDANTNALVGRLAGTFTPSPALHSAAERAQALNVQLFERVRASGALRPGIAVTDIAMIFEQLASVQFTDDQRTAQLRRRYLELNLEAIAAPHAQRLPGHPPTWNELSRRWTQTPLR